MIWGIICGVIYKCSKMDWKNFSGIRLSTLWIDYDYIVRRWNLIVFDRIGPTISKIVFGNENELKINGNKIDFGDNVDKKFQWTLSLLVCYICDDLNILWIYRFDNGVVALWSLHHMNVRWALCVKKYWMSIDKPAPFSRWTHLKDIIFIWNNLFFALNKQ